MNNNMANSKGKAFRSWITADGVGSSGFQAESGRYHLYLSLACPWAHRILCVLRLKGLDDVITVTLADWMLEKEGWSFTDQRSKCTLDNVNNCKFLKEVYLKADPDYQGEAAVPCLWDRRRQTVVNEDSADIMRMLNTEFNAFCKTPQQRSLDLYPAGLRSKIDAINDWVSPKVNHGVYSCGLAKSQKDYNSAVTDLFAALDKAEAILSSSRYLTGHQLTGADICLFTTLVRFDKVYHNIFKTNKKQILDYPNLWGFVRDIYQIPGIADTVDMEHIMGLYYASPSMRAINPEGIIPVGPDLDFMQPHNRA